MDGERALAAEHDALPDLLVHHRDPRQCHVLPPFPQRDPSRIAQSGTPAQPDARGVPADRAPVVTGQDPQVLPCVAHSASVLRPQRHRQSLLRPLWIRVPAPPPCGRHAGLRGGRSPRGGHRSARRAQVSEAGAPGKRAGAPNRELAERPRGTTIKAKPPLLQLGFSFRVQRRGWVGGPWVLRVVGARSYRLEECHGPPIPSSLPSLSARTSWSRGRTMWG